jgi:hypothetical protein
MLSFSISCHSFCMSSKLHETSTLQIQATSAIREKEETRIKEL